MADEGEEATTYLKTLFQQQLASRSDDQKPRQYQSSELRDYIDLKNEIGEGGYGRVYKIRLNNQQVALKVMKSSSSESSARTRLGFLLERCALMVNNENIVHFLGYCADPQLYAIVMEYIPKSVDRVMKGFQFVDAINVLLAAARGLLAVHGNNPKILHRDIKPSNFLYKSKNSQKLIDFGSAKIGEVKTPTFGTRGYRDTAAGSGEDEACDVFSWSKLGLAVLTKNEKTFEGGTRNVLEKLKKSNISIDVNDNFTKEIRQSGFTKEIGIKIFEFLYKCQSRTISERPKVIEIIQFLEEIAKELPSTA